MKKTLAATILLAAVLTPAGLLMHAQQQQQRPIDPIVLTWDAGPATIDVARYSPNMKKNYKVFTELCSRCHTLARAINSDFVLESDWERYIKKMMRRAGTKIINPDDALLIYEFLVYDSKIRKKELYDRKLAALQ